MTCAVHITGGVDECSPMLVRSSSPEIDGFGIIMPVRFTPMGWLASWPEVKKQLAARGGKSGAPQSGQPKVNVRAMVEPRPVRWVRFFGIPLRMEG
jgi:hypothetical protein